MANKTPHCVVLRARGQVKTVTYDSLEPIFLGRSTRCDLRVGGKHVSRIHAVVEARKDGFYLIDKSINGTFVMKDGSSGQEIPPSGEAKLTGSGLISLGSQVDLTSKHLIRYRCES